MLCEQPCCKAISALRNEMDPVSILSVISASSTIALRIATIVHSLNKVCERYHDAGVTLGLLISELTAVKAAVIQIEDWAEYNFTDRFVPTDLRTAFRESLEECGFAVPFAGRQKYVSPAGSEKLFLAVVAVGVGVKTIFTSVLISARRLAKRPLLSFELLKPARFRKSRNF